MHTIVKKTRIIATLGPASQSAEVIEDLLESGVNVFRLNFSHGTHEEHSKLIKRIRSVSNKIGIHVGILADLQGPKIRTGRTHGDQIIALKKGSLITLTTHESLCTETSMYINYPSLIHEILEGQTILINDGAIRLHIDRVFQHEGKAHCRVMNNGIYSSHKGVNFPNTLLKIPSLSEKDRKDLQFILTQDINFIALSFVRRGEDMQMLVREIENSEKVIKCIAKIEKPEAVQNIAEILSVSDGIMVARGDLGVETPIHYIPLVQKKCIAEANALGKIVIVATQMLESMIKNPIPTRAETTDIANAILDGTDAVMLSGETAVGEYPVESVEIMAQISVATENSPYFSKKFVDLSLKKGYPPHAICQAARWASHDLGEVPIIVFSASGATALYLSNIRNHSPIFVFSPYIHVAQILSLAWNVQPFVLSIEQDMLVLQKKAESILLEHSKVKKGDTILVVCGTSITQGATNLLRVKKVGED